MEAVGQQLDRLREIGQSVPLVLLIWLIVVVAVAVVLYSLWKALGRRRQAAPAEDLEEPVDVSSLEDAGPPAGFPVLEFYYMPVRLAAVVLAPAGRGRELPALHDREKLFEAVVPGLSAVVAAHRPLVRLWPNQLSVSGFVHKFFNRVRLPGDAGKGTPWCSAAGVFKLKGEPYMVGLVLRASAETSHGQFAVEEETKWLDLLRVKQE